MFIDKIGCSCVYGGSMHKDENNVDWETRDNKDVHGGESKHQQLLGA